MKTRTAIFVAVWVISLGIAITIGGKTRSNNSELQANSAESRASARSTSRASFRSNSRASIRSISGRANARANDPASIMANSDPMERTQDLINYISSLGADDFEQAVANFRKLGMVREDSSEYIMLLHAWGKTDSITALEYADKNPDPEPSDGSSPNLQYCKEAILAGWASEDLDAALAWVRGNPDAKGASILTLVANNFQFVGIIHGIASKDPFKAMEIMVTIPVDSTSISETQQRALKEIIPHVVSLGSEKATEWLDTIADPSIRSEAAAWLAAAMFTDDPAEAATWVSGLKEPAAASMLSWKLAKTDLAAALIWTDTLQGKSKTAAAYQIITEYAKKDPAKAAAWMETMSGQQGYSAIMINFISAAAEKDPELALSYIPRIKQENSKNSYYESTLRTWLSNDRAAAEKWLEKNPEAAEIHARYIERSNSIRHGWP